MVYELALRALERQERELSELRTRASTVIAAAALVASFLGAAAIRKPGLLSEWPILALGSLALTGAFNLMVLWPRELRFAFDAPWTYAELYPVLARVDEAQLRIAYHARDHYRSNKEVIDGLEYDFRLAVLWLGLQTLCWAIALG